MGSILCYHSHLWCTWMQLNIMVIVLILCNLIIYSWEILPWEFEGTLDILLHHLDTTMGI